MAGPEFSNLPGDVALFTESDLYVLLDSGAPANITDADSQNYTGGRLTIIISGGYNSGEDRLSIGDNGLGGINGISTGRAFNEDLTNPRDVVYYNQVPNSHDEIIGRIVSDGSNGQIIIDLGPDPRASAGTVTTLDEVIALVRAITYSNSNGNDPATHTRTITFTLTDGSESEENSTTFTTTVEVEAINDAPTISGPSSGVTYENVSVSATGENGVQSSTRSSPGMTPDGTFVVFHSSASVLVPGDTNNVADIFVKNLVDGSIERVSVSSQGEEANGASGSVVLPISDDGRYVLFRSSASNLVANDTNGEPDIFLRDIVAGTTTRVSTDSNDQQVDGGADTAWAVSNDGRYVLFASDAAFVAADTNGTTDLYWKDLSTGEVKLASANAAGQPGFNIFEERPFFASYRTADMSADGHYVVFESTANNLVENYNQGSRDYSTTDVFIKDMETGEVTLIERNSGGASQDDSVGGIGVGSQDVKISGNGQFVVFASHFSDLVEGDTNGRIDVFLWDRNAAPGSKLTIISTNSSGEQANTGAGSPNISENGRYVVFVSSATNLVDHSVPTGTEFSNVYVKDLWTGTVRYVGQSTAGESDRATVTNDGKVVAYSAGFDYATGDTDESVDVYVARFSGSGEIPVTEDVVSPIRGISFEDVDSGTGNVTVVFSVPRGTLSATSAGNVTVSATATSVTLTGTIANINTFLAQDRLLYLTVLDDTNPVSLSVTINDNGNSGQDPGLTGTATSEADSETFTLVVIPVNDPPTLANNGLTVNDGAGAAITQANLNAQDVDNTNTQLVYTVTQGPAHGTLFKNGSALGSDTFTQDDLNNGRITYVHNGDDAVSDSFSFALRDNVEGPAIEQSLEITIVQVDAADINEAPVNTVPATLEFEANVPAAITGLSVADDAGTSVITTKLAVLFGVLTVGAIDGATVVGSGTSTVTITGTLAQINATLAGNNVLYSGPLDFFGTDTLTMVTDDQGNTGTGGPLSDTDQVTIYLNTYQHGTSGDDSFHALMGNAFIDAAAGLDTVTFDFALVDAKITYNGSLVIIEGPSSRTVLRGVETYEFTDGTVETADDDRLVDDLYYYSHNHDVWNAQADADAHYHTFGWKEGRDPNAFFDTSFYFDNNPDVKAAGIDPLVHFDQFGWKEGRDVSLLFDPDEYLAFYADVAAADRNPLEHFLRHGSEEARLTFPAKGIAENGFDANYYLLHNPDVAASGVDPFEHFQTVGWMEGRNPNAMFDTAGYLATYGDVAAAHINPLDHYNQTGWLEGRDPSVHFDTTEYLAAYTDVAAVGFNPLWHYLYFGIHEGRSTFADDAWG